MSPGNGPDRPRRQSVCRQVTGHGNPGRNVVAAHDVGAGWSFVRHDGDGRQPGLRTRAEQGAFAALGLGGDDPVDPPCMHPLEDQARIIGPAELEAGQHEPGVASRELLLDPGQELNEPRIGARIDDDRDAAPAPQAQVSRRPRPRVAKCLDHLTQPSPHRLADIVAIEIARNRADGNTRSGGNSRDRGVLLHGLGGASRE